MKVNKKLTVFLLSGVMAVMSCSIAPTFAVSDSVPDPDGDGVIGINDAVMILQYLNGKFEPTDLDELDIDGNGVISPMDAYYAQLYESGWLTKGDT
ncbi:MAG: hypothetical protein K2J08_12355 [Ruminococcus sp.]|nr:hypothetical protein [Ruminococcus sp.]